MNERLLQFIWQFQYYNRSSLQTSSGHPLHIGHAGAYNTGQGPDFSNAKVIIGNTTWAGHIELHLRSSDWHRHQHSADPNYANVILHVVWEHDGEITLPDGAIIPVLHLQPLVPMYLITRYEQLMQQQSFVPCQSNLPVLSPIAWLAWKERIATERLQRKAQQVLDLLQQSNHNWEETFWWLLARNFGIKTNAAIFETIARSLPVNILAKHKHQLIQLEALLLGQARLLESDFEEDYPILLKREYRFLKNKYNLHTPQVSPFFLRMRPATFPTVRLAQLAMLVHQSSHLFSKIKEASTVADIKQWLNVKANDYWHYHYRLNEGSTFHPKQLGDQMVENIIINTVVPVLFAYGHSIGAQAVKDRALNLLAMLAAEKNTITSKWKTLGVPAANAVESQALIELKNNYCDERHCLRCAIGNNLLGRT